MRRAIPLALGLAVVAGCAGGPAARTRPAVLELTTEEGRWRVDSNGGATLSRDGWRLRLVATAVSTFSPVPYLEELALEIINTSPEQPLVLMPGDVFIVDPAGGNVRLGPRDKAVLQPGRSVVLGYAPGRRARPLPHPFIVSVTVSWGLDARRVDTASLKLH